MTESTHARRLVRAGFLKWSAAAFLVVLPFAVAAVWDYVENRRFDEAIHQIQLKGEPTQFPVNPPAWDTDEASRRYRAAGALASNFHTDARLPLRDLVSSMQKDEWPADARESLRSTLGPYEEAMALADRAGELPFDMFRPGTSYNYRSSDMLAVQEISGYRAILRALDGDADGAVSSLYSEAKTARTMGTFLLGQRMPRPFIVAQVLERSKPSAAALARLSGALTELDDDREMSRWFEELRRNVITSGWQSITLGSVETPLLTVLGLRHPAAMHRVNETIATFTQIIVASHEPWPRRLDAVDAVNDAGVWPLRSSGGVTARLGESIASQVAGFRALRSIVAVELYRRHHDEQLPNALADLAPAYIPAVPVDPFSGSGLVYKKEPGGYAVYSLGVNRKDDGGADVNLPFVGSYLKEHPADVGVRLRYR